jgi:hypothetical protein
MHLEKFQINISSRRIFKRNFESAWIHFTSMAFERMAKSLEDIQVFFSKWNSECLAKGAWVNVWLFWSLCNVLTAFDPPFKRVFCENFNGGFRLL